MRINMLILYADQHRFDCLGCLGNPDVRTPNIDRLAAEGVRFPNAFTCFPVCTPARYSLLCGRPAHDHGGWSNHSTPRPEWPTFPALMAAQGYRTAAVGKMHYTPTYLDVGFERMLLAEQDGPGRWDDDYHRHLRALGLVDRHDLEDQREEYRNLAPPDYWTTFGARESNLPDAYHSTTWIGDRAVEILDDWTSGGNLLMAGFVKPHHPFDPPAPWSRMYDPDSLTLLPGWTERVFERDQAANAGYFPNASLTEPALRRAMAGYYATLSHIDREVGRMIETLRRKGALDNTLIVYTADHGEYLGFHHMLLKGGFLYDPLVRIPLIVRWPGAARAGTTDVRLASCLDLPPTMLRMAGLRPPDTMTGLNLARADAARDVVFAERMTDRTLAGRPLPRPGCQVMARSRTRKLIRGPAPEDTLFFDLERDPLEREDRSADSGYAGDIRRLRQAADAWLNPCIEPIAHLEEQAPVIRQPNVPALDDGHQDEIAAWFRQSYKETRAP